MGNRHFRAGVVAIVERSDGMICAFERADAPGAWQLPQGGIEKGEEPDDAVWRELKEETGLSAADVELVAEHPEWIVYTWPAEIAGRKGLGQVQRWYTFCIRDDASEPVPDGEEFTAWRWVERAWLVDQVIDFKRDGYRKVLLEGTSR